MITATAVWRWIWSARCVRDQRRYMGVRKQLDLFGVLVLAFAAATAGGIARDALIGATPPAALADWRYLAVSIFAGLITFTGTGAWSGLVTRCSCSMRSVSACSPLQAPRRHWPSASARRCRAARHAVRRRRWHRSRSARG